MPRQRIVYTKKLVFGKPYIKSKKVVNKTTTRYYPYLSIPMTITVVEKDKPNRMEWSRYIGSKELYSIKTGRFTKEFWRYLALLGGNKQWESVKEPGKKRAQRIRL